MSWCRGEVRSAKTTSSVPFFIRGKRVLQLETRKPEPRIESHVISRALPDAGSSDDAFPRISGRESTADESDRAIELSEG